MPFENKGFEEINREERSYCALFAHALLAARSVRQRLAAFASERWNASLDPDDLQVFVEAATLRDYWDTLVPKHTRKAAKNERRRQILAEILDLYGISSEMIDDDLFWSKKKTGERHLLQSPGRWSLSNLKAITARDARCEALREVRFAFNAKPDLMMLSQETVLFIEAKLYSGEGRSEEKQYKQFEIPEKIANLLKCLAPAYQTHSFHCHRLERLNAGLRCEPVLTWSAVAEMVDCEEVDLFTRRQLRRAALPPGANAEASSIRSPRRLARPTEG